MVGKFVSRGLVLLMFLSLHSTVFVNCQTTTAPTTTTTTATTTTTTVAANVAIGVPGFGIALLVLAALILALLMCFPCIFFFSRRRFLLRR
ncbi:mucin-like protein 1 isoform X2 [Ascaphus truei]|uniref:mucin-like protein 1 isoform X2 n=1 Tax=Ascaphus truei TaxID=8439 RepID=UPI003F5AD33F